MGSLKMAFKMVVAPIVALALLVVAQGDSECSDGECDNEASALLALRQNVTLHDHLSLTSDTRRRLPPVHCKNSHGDSFPCQGGGECCGNACAAPGSKCCKPFGPKSAWYPVSEDTPCLHESTQCRNDQGNKFECAAGDRCCGGACVAHGDACCENVLGNHFPCQRNNKGEGGCCGNACYAPGSKCCWSPWVAKSRWYPVTKATKCAF